MSGRQSLWGGLRGVLESGVVRDIAANAVSAVGEAIGQNAERSLRRSARKPIPPAELSLALIAARLAELPYRANTPDLITAGLSVILAEPERLWFQPQDPGAHTSQWFLARGVLPPGTDGPAAGPALFLVFRGTKTFNDACNDLMAMPKAGPNGGWFHGGFLRALQDDGPLHAALATYLSGGERLYVFGHSLGGSLALTLWGAGFLPRSHTGHVTVVALGSPAVHHGPAQLSEAQSRARVLLVVNGADVIPRLLGSSMMLTKGVLAGLDGFRQQRGGPSIPTRIIETLEGYSHPPQLELVHLEGGRAYQISPDGRADVLHLAEGLNPSAIDDHSRYVQALEVAGAPSAGSTPVPAGLPVGPPESTVPMGVPLGPAAGGAAAGGASAPEAAVLEAREVEPGSMRISALKAELKARGVPTAGLLEKQDLVRALREARALE